LFSSTSIALLVHLSNVAQLKVVLLEDLLGLGINERQLGFHLNVDSILLKGSRLGHLDLFLLHLGGELLDRVHREEHCRLLYLIFLGGLVILDRFL